ncbi:universal stress protein [Parasphingorhabdus halotolerans]|uniref:Universal stress protein n=1 Tax=Parasphingorhabdus halotolerans TaxID=2725558 RepID=A0A6H2DQ89_9SPHN|nr:universal stress protein [Parasphingorhabdus halotolerans]QJB70504.1 universal stress protein [Parasphingorhabdus halotolerans]
MKHKPILLATDMTARCDRPLDRALMLAKLWETQLIIAHVVDPKTAGKKGLIPSDISIRIREELPVTDVDVRISVHMGNISDEILGVAKSEGCGLIVTGVAHYDGISDIFLGTPVDHLLRSAPIPILIVKRKPILPYDNIVIATDFSSCALKALNTAAALFPKSPLHLVHAYHVPYTGWLKSDAVEKEVDSEEAKLMERFLAQTSIDNETFDRLSSSIEKGEPGKIILQKIEETKSELVVLGTSGRSGTVHTSLGTNARLVLGWLKQDVLMVRE